MNSFSIKDVLKKNVMTIALFVIYVFFIIGTGGNMFTPSNVTSLIEQNAYVYILGVGMLMCMLTGGNIDLSVGSFVCFMGAVAGVFSVIKYVGTPLTLFIVIGVGLVYGAVLGFLIAYLKIPPWIATLAGFPRHPLSPISLSLSQDSSRERSSSHPGVSSTSPV